ncbi:SpoIIE family protein phosphatase [Actinomadura kijaniata]|uniref:Serine phosphatase RsbU (Regulator of sigma subunit) n=1 Tax=Actinomadura namibiensis TaxID=182080 RepID=A0A7W3LII5_ACTNM|nr:SpoIIE family protein phosphatase [Actinomadura namibiensis]MBA8948756.1 serine phosphatase RsbU (regulator of sigma subunit) [Actinomadura namibiensis]
MASEPAAPAAPAPDRPTTTVSGVSRLAATVERLRREVRRAQAAADGRGVIELAKGVLVERLHCGPAEAARQLHELADEAGVTPLELAAEIIDQAAQDRMAEATRGFLDQAVRRAQAEHAAEQAAEQAARLRTAESGALAAPDAQAVAESLLRHALAPLGAAAVAVWAADGDGSLTLAGWAGFTEEEATRWRYVPPGVVTPAWRALTERRPVWLDSLGGSGPPSIGLHECAGGRVAVPAGTGGRLIGVLEVCWPGAPEDRSPRVERQLEALAELCAHTLETRPAAGLASAALPATAYRDLPELIDLADGLHDPVLVLRPHIDAGGALADFRIHHVNGHFADLAGRPRTAVVGTLLLECYPLAAEQGGLFDKIERVYATGEPFRADRMVLNALVDEVPLSATAAVSISRLGDSVLLTWRIEDEAARLANLLQHAQRLGRVGGFEENLVTGETLWNAQLFQLHGLPPTASPVPLAELPDHAHPDDEPAIGRFLRTLLHHHRPASAAFRLHRSDGVVRHLRIVAEPVLDTAGHLLAVRGAYQDISAQHWTEVALAATRDRLAHTEQQAVERNRLTLQLQRAIMPATRGPIDAAGLSVAVRYRPAEEESAVGGDWYDAVVLPSGRVLLCVGDVAGHGIDAATGMVVLRNALRGLAATGAGPGQILGWLNLVAHHLTDYVTATALCGLYDPETRVLRWARAGHLPPVLVRAGESATLPLVGGLMLGALDEAEYEEGEFVLEPDDVLLMYTDGLVERRDGTMQEALEHLLATARGPAASLETRLDHLLTHSNADTADDTCIVGVHLPPA